MEVASPEIRYLGRRSAARYLGVSVRLLDKIAAQKRLPVCRPSRRRVLFCVEDLDRYMQECKSSA